MYSYGSPHMAAQKQDDQLERTFSSYVRIQAVVLKTYLGRWTIGRSGERGSGISVLPARYDDDDDDDDDDIYTTNHTYNKYTSCGKKLNVSRIRTIINKTKQKMLRVISLKEKGGFVLTLIDYCSFFAVSVLSGSNSSNNSSLSCWRK